MTFTENFLAKHTADGFAEFKGLELSGEIPISEEFLNGVIQQFLANQSGFSPNTDLENNHTSQRLDLNVLLSRVEKFEIRAVTGKVILEFQVRVE